jgi:hypothetical protein
MVGQRYMLRLEDFEMSLLLVPVSSLLPHEEIIPEFLERLAHAIEEDEVIKNPVIADANSLVVLDGNHRVEAFKKLGYGLIPVCLVDYRSPRIEVMCWYRTIEGRDHTRLAEVVDGFYSLSANPKITAPIDSANTLAVITEVGTIMFKPNGSLLEAYRALKELETRLRDSGFEIGYSSEEGAFQRVQDGSLLGYIAMPPLTKEVIVEVAESGKRLPSKTSRHTLPARPMGVNFPLRLLGSGADLEDASREFCGWLSQRHVTRMPPRSLYEERLYYESLFVFHD